MMVGVVMVGVMGCGQEAPAGKATESAGQAVVDSIKTPLDKSRAVEGALEKAVGKTAGTVKDATQ